MRAIIDMDGTIVDFTNPAIERAKELFNINLEFDKLDTPHMADHIWERMTKDQRILFEKPWNLYHLICSNGFFLNLPALPGAIDAVKQIAATGIEVVFCTKIMHWETAWEKAEWLRRYFEDIKYLLVIVDKHESKKLINADIIVDDDPRVLDTLELPARILIKQPWNTNHRHKYNFVVKDMAQAAEVIIGHKPYIDFFDIENPFGAPGC